MTNKEIKLRTLQQNKALHLWFSQLADELNLAGLDVKKTLSQDIEHPWTPNLIKELIFRPVMTSYLQKTSTTKLTTAEIDKVFDVINKFIGEQFGLHITFPSIEALMDSPVDNRTR